MRKKYIRNNVSKLFNSAKRKSPIQKHGRDRRGLCFFRCFKSYDNMCFHHGAVLSLSVKITHG